MYFIPFILLIGTFVSLKYGSYFYYGFTGLIIAISLILNIFKQPQRTGFINSNHSRETVDVFKKYFVSIRYPKLSLVLSKTLLTSSLCLSILATWYFFNRQHELALVSILLIPMSLYFALRFRPLYFLSFKKSKFLKTVISSYNKSKQHNKYSNPFEAFQSISNFEEFANYVEENYEEFVDYVTKNNK